MLKREFGAKYTATQMLLYLYAEAAPATVNGALLIAIVTGKLGRQIRTISRKPGDLPENNLQLSGGVHRLRV